MSKTKFRYNHKTLSYERVQKSFGERVLIGIIYFAPTIVLSLLFGLIISYRIDSSKEKRMKAELDDMKIELSNWQERLNRIDRITEELRIRDEELYRTALGAKEFPEELRLMGVGGSDKYNKFDGTSNQELLVQTLKKIDEIEGKLYAQAISFQELVKLTSEKEKRLASLPAIQPVRNSDLKRVASGYGWRVDPIYKTKKMHWGLDFTADIGTEVYATADGVVEEVTVNSWGYGKEIVINHGFGFKTRFAHLSKFNVKKGQTIKRGEVIGYVGNSGKSTGPHLHYEVEQNGQKVNPIGFFHSDLTPEQFEEIIQLSNNALKSLD